MHVNTLYLYFTFKLRKYRYCTEDIHCKEAINGNQRCILNYDNDNSTLIPLNNSQKPPSTCRNKKLFSPYSWTDGLFTAITFIGGAIAAGSGIGGGGIIVPTLVVVGKFSVEDAIPLSSVRIFELLL